MSMVLVFEQIQAGLISVVLVYNMREKLMKQLMQQVMVSLVFSCYTSLPHYIIDSVILQE